MNKKSIFSVLVVMMLFLQGCQASQVQTQAPTETTAPLIKLKVQLIPYLSYAPLYIAQEEGYFKEQGIEVDFQKLQGGSAFVAVVSGDIDVAATFLTSNLLSAMRTAKFTLNCSPPE